MELRRHIRPRIIPARAGFTVEWRFQRREEQDHPRSRGVYCGALGAACASRGSSPLARGLHVKQAWCTAQLGIIPARAGFTRRGLILRVGGEDHPRSRGVYSTLSYEYHEKVGSSPLARGLLVVLLLCGSACRIIPARAGFTTSFIRPGKTVVDHPRSRGVYLPFSPGDSSTPGSSPLARGLLYGGQKMDFEARIIPARAGVTYDLLSKFSAGTDHPRSRGVYAKLFLNSLYGKGSSPLARGLLSGVDGATPFIWIIPARAGFTLGDPWNPNDHSPYQTASAFTADLAPARRRCGSAAVERRSTMTPSGA